MNVTVANYQILVFVTEHQVVLDVEVPEINLPSLINAFRQLKFSGALTNDEWQCILLENNLHVSSAFELQGD